MNTIKKVGCISLILTFLITLAISTSAQVIIPNLPESNLITTPSIITEINTKAEFEALSSEQNSATVIFEVNDEGNIIIEDLFTKTPAEIIALCTNTIPAFEVENETELEKLFSNIGDSLLDFFIVSTDYEILKTAREKNIYARGVLRISDIYKNEDGTYDLLKVRSDSNTASCHVVILPQEISNKTNTAYLQQLLMGVWVEAANGDYGTVAATLTGANGIITDQAKKNRNRIYREIQ